MRDAIRKFDDGIIGSDQLLEELRNGSSALEGVADSLLDQRRGILSALEMSLDLEREGFRANPKKDISVFDLWLSSI
jgi:hypothetical protein